MSQADFYRAFTEVQRTLAPLPAEGAAVATAAHQCADAAIARSPEAGTRACASGCSFCCHFPVGVTFAEAERLLQALAGEPALQDRVISAAAETARLSWQQLAAAMVPCPLLRDGNCAVYAARPLGCRGWNSADASACAAGTSVPLDEPAYTAALGASAALTDWAARVHLPVAARELGSALAAMLAVPDATARRAAFTGARPVG